MKSFLFGILLGIANLIPGVSGGTMAVILNIYDRIILALGIKDIKKNISFLLPLVIGAIIGIFIFSKGITYLFENFNMTTNFSFIGLVIGSIPLIYNKVKFRRIEEKNWIPFLIALFFMIALSIIKLMLKANGGIFTIEELAFIPKMVWLYISATISTIGMILPGISGSFLMLLLGAYTVTLRAITEFDIIILLPVLLGVITGGMAGVVIVRNLIKEHPQALYLGIMGLMIGSVFSIYPGLTPDKEGIISIIAMVICAAISYYFGKMK